MSQIFPLTINIKAFRKHYAKTIACKEMLDANTDILCCDDKKRIEALIDIEVEHSCEAVKRVVTNANRQNFDLNPNILANKYRKKLVEKGKHGGLINDIAIHDIDSLSYLTDYKISDIIGARCRNVYAIEEPVIKD